jgi:hypothetical protein
VEDYRIDFEDGYGYRADEEEDGHAASAAKALRQGMNAGSLPPFTGLRVKSFGPELRRRSTRTLELFLRALGAPLPPNFAVTLPKIVCPEEVASDGASNLGRFAAAGRARVRGAHFGPFDYTSSIGIASNAQDLLHPACDMARHMMQIAYTPLGIWLSDGPTNIMPVPRDRGAEGVHDAWRLHFRNVRHALRMGLYQGWDLHPAQLVTRYAAVYSFYHDAIADASARLRNFVDRAAQATMVGQTFDDAATGQGLLNFFLRAINCGALTAEEAHERTGLSHSEIVEGSFAGIVRSRL